MLQGDLIEFWQSGTHTTRLQADGIHPVKNFRKIRHLKAEVRSVLQKAESYGADYVLFRLRDGRFPAPEALVFDEAGATGQPRSDEEFADLHRRLWSWGRVPLIYRRVLGRVDLFRCGHKPDFDAGTERPVYRVYDTLRTAIDITDKLNEKPWWDLRRLTNGTLWDDVDVAKRFLSDDAAHATLLKHVKNLDTQLCLHSRLRENLRRRLLVISLLVAYLEDRDVFRLEPGFFARYKSDARSFFDVLSDAESLIRLLGHLERERFNGNVFTLETEEKEQLRQTRYLPRFASLLEGKSERGGQLTLWRLYSFRDLPIELISHIYQHFVQDRSTCVYTPPFVARLMLDESLVPERLDRLETHGEIIFDPACGSGIFLVEAFKKILLHWRATNQWKHPSVQTLRRLLLRVTGTDIDPYAIELASFSLCLAMCEELDAATILNTPRLFPKLRGQTLHSRCFFDMKRKGSLPKRIGLIIGNPPFESGSTKGTAGEAEKEFMALHGQTSLPDRQAAYLFLYHSLEALTSGGLLCLLQKDNFLYNRRSVSFRRRIFRHWDVREILDLTPIRNLFVKDSKVVVVMAEARTPEPDRPILHAIFRRTAKTRAEQSFELDYYDMHWLSHDTALHKPFVWRCNLFGGGRAVELVERLKKLPTLKEYIALNKWDYGEGFIKGTEPPAEMVKHLWKKPVIPAGAVGKDGVVDVDKVYEQQDRYFESPRSESRYQPPMILIRQTDDFRIAYWDEGYLTYDQEVLGITLAAGGDRRAHAELYGRLERNRPFYRGWLSLTSARAGIDKATALQKKDIDDVPFPQDQNKLKLSLNEEIILNDAFMFYRDFQRLGDESEMMRQVRPNELSRFAQLFTRQLGTIYETVRELPAHSWIGASCMPFVLGDGEPDWTGADNLQEKLDTLLRSKQTASVTTIRLVRLFDGPFVFLLKPDRLRYWLPSIALRDADETLADFRAMGF